MNLKLLLSASALSLAFAVVGCGDGKKAKEEAKKVEEAVEKGAEVVEEKVKDVVEAVEDTMVKGLDSVEDTTVEALSPAEEAPAAEDSDGASMSQ